MQKMNDAGFFADLALAVQDLNPPAEAKRQGRDLLVGRDLARRCDVQRVVRQVSEGVRLPVLVLVRAQLRPRIGPRTGMPGWES